MPEDGILHSHRRGNLKSCIIRMIKWMDLGEMGWGGVDWINIAQDKYKWRTVVNSVMNPRVP
jgi:hypothetical protein